MSDKMLLSVPEVCEALSLGQSLVKSLMRQGRIASVTIEGRRLVPVESLRAFVDALPREAGWEPARRTGSSARA